MNISYWVADFGNALGQQMIDGHYFEMPSSISEITEKEFNGLFANHIAIDKVEEHLVIKWIDEETARYFMAGKRAQTELLGNAHIYSLHDKTNSMTVWVTWMAGLALYHATKFPESTEVHVNVEYFGTLLPVWLVKKAASFREKLSVMAAKFQTDVSFELLTPGLARTFHVSVQQSESRIEGENARHALKYDLEGNQRDDAKRYHTAFVVMNDMGGQSQDLCKLQPGLSAAQTADDFSSSTDQSYLSLIEKLRSDKLMDYFQSLRELERFILTHIQSRKFVYRHPITHQDTDLTDIIVPVLQDFCEVALQKALQSFSFRQGDEVIYVHIGGVNELLQYYMQEYLVGLLGKEVVDKYHVFPQDSRKLNIYASAIVAKNYLKRQAEKANRAE
ncbi:hypothetical protein PAT3040_03994 [Paenibacillus agaridevorans]|uniref:Alp7A-like C-terminal domain-containing protein n=1 Tax=Paenibacillus agaridevorans TaxID=171404 RepID=A0A2R5ERP2_9BACL|nr:hypothetical protein [Paenibacillus agaridevorans]GBG09350.1 hypothetical protein PAT3040_03994 [Paenibacillus agaridevorans]